MSQSTRRSPFLSRWFGASKTIVPSASGTMLDRYNTSRSRLVLLSGIAVLGGAYIWLVNSSTAASFQAADLRTQIATLDSDYQKLTIAKSQAEHLGRLQAYSKSAGMEPTASLVYSQEPSTVALSE